MLASVLLIILICVGLAVLLAYLRKTPKSITGGSEPTTEDWARNSRIDFETNDPTLKNKTIHVYYYAPWCPYCVLFQPVINEAAAATGIRFQMVNRDNGKIPGVKYVPSVIKIRPNGTIEVYKDEKTTTALSTWLSTE